MSDSQVSRMGTTIGCTTWLRLNVSSWFVITAACWPACWMALTSRRSTESAGIVCSSRSL